MTSSAQQPPRQAHSFELHLNDDEYRLIERAATNWQLSVTDFLVESALEKAIAITEEDVSSHLATVTSDEIHSNPSEADSDSASG